MDKELEQIYKELEDELVYLFSNIISNNLEQQSEECKYHVRYKTTSGIYNRREKGTVIIGSEEGNKVSYAYRLIFNDSENKPSRKYWYSDDFGMKSISFFSAKKSTLLVVFLKTVAVKLTLYQKRRLIM